MKIQIKFKDKLYKKINYLMKNIDDLNGGKEIGAWMLGDWKYLSDSLILELDEMYIYKQSVSGSEVNIDEESMIEVINTLGIDKSNRIKALWHIHPFNKGNTNWSYTDEENMSEFMDMNKNRDIFAFILSSLTEIKAKVVINYMAKIPIFNKEIKIQQSFDDVDIVNESKIDYQLHKELSKEIKSKVSNVVYNDCIKYDKKYSDRKIYDYYENELISPLEVLDEEDIKEKLGLLEDYSN